MQPTVIRLSEDKKEKQRGRLNIRLLQKLVKQLNVQK